MSAQRQLTQQERRDWVRLARCEGVGPVTFFGLLARFGTVSTVLAELPALLKQSGRKSIKMITNDQAEDEVAATVKMGGQIIAACEQSFSPALAAIMPPPPILSVRGDVRLLQRPTLGVVGARNASAAGIRLAREMSEGVGKAGFVIASGLARGIDGAAHNASLPTGTIAVLAGGIDYVYPYEHKRLHQEIGERGLLVSESPLFASVHARDFPRRNRIIAGLSLAVLVIEAEARSGSLITARMAAEQGRDVMAVPGSPLDPRAAGTNGLIREGARLVTCVEDILDNIRNSAGLRERERPHVMRSSESLEIDPSMTAQIAALLSPVPTSLEELSRITALPWRTVAAIIVELELTGRAIVQSGGLVTIPV